MVPFSNLSSLSLTPPPAYDAFELAREHAASPGVEQE
jgi:hypothetical protein